MAAIALALGSSLVWGCADFMGGFFTRRLTLAAVTVVSQRGGLRRPARLARRNGPHARRAGDRARDARRDRGRGRARRVLPRARAGDDEHRLAGRRLRCAGSVRARAGDGRASVGTRDRRRGRRARGRGARVGRGAPRGRAGPATRSAAGARRSARDRALHLCLFVLASARGYLSIVSVLGSLYPIVTVLAAHVLLGERISRVQLGGVALPSPVCP